MTIDLGDIPSSAEAFSVVPLKRIVMLANDPKRKSPSNRAISPAIVANYQGLSASSRLSTLSAD